MGKIVIALFARHTRRSPPPPPDRKSTRFPTLSISPPLDLQLHRILERLTKDNGRHLSTSLPPQRRNNKPFDLHVSLRFVPYRWRDYRSIIIRRERSDCPRWNDSEKTGENGALMDASFRHVIERGMFSHPTPTGIFPFFHRSPLAWSKTGLWFTAGRTKEVEKCAMDGHVPSFTVPSFYSLKNYHRARPRFAPRGSKERAERWNYNIYSARFNLIRAYVGLKILFPPFPATPRWRKNALQESNRAISRTSVYSVCRSRHVSRSAEPISF